MACPGCDGQISTVSTNGVTTMWMRLQVAGIVSLVTVTACAQELLKNGGFEELNAKGFPAAWSRYGGNVPESVTKSVDEAHSGGKAVRMIDTGPNERNSKWSTGVCQTVPVKADKMYLLTVWAKGYARNHAQAMNLQLRFLPSNSLRNVFVTPRVAGGWQKFSVCLAAPKGTTHARVYIYSQHFWTCDTLIDDASLVEVSNEKFGGRLPLMTYGGMGIDAPRALKLSTQLVAEGKPAATICIPSDTEYAPLGKRIQKAVQDASGAVVPITTDARGLVKTDRTIIALGNMNNNFVIERLYFNKYTPADSLYPGPGRYTIRTVHQPFNFDGNVNVLMVGASDIRGADAGVDTLLKMLPKGRTIVFDKPLLLVSDNRPMTTEQAGRILEMPLTRDWFRCFWTAAKAYRDTGDLVHARNARRILLEIAGRCQNEPAHHITWPDETTSNMIGSMWDVIEEAPVFSDSERLTCMNTLLLCLYSLPRHVSGWGRQTDNDTITWNHTTFPILGIYYLARYFRRWYGDVDGKLDHMLGEVHGCFRGQFKSWKPQCDADGYLTIVPRHIVDYSLAENNYAWFESGMARKHAEYLTALCDNRGAIPGLGDSGYGTGPGYESTGLPWAIWYYRDARYLWRLQQVYDGKWANPYDPTLQPAVWKDMVGLTVTRLNPENYNYSKTRSYYGEPVTPPNVPYERAFDKVTFRENLDRNGEFLLLDGYASGKHLHYDGNAIIKFYADGHDWLIDGDYLVRNTTDHSMVSVIKSGRCDKLIPVCTGLDQYADLRSVAFVNTTVHDYNGADWRRMILWEKGQYFLAIDECTAKEEADFTFEAVWKALDTGALRLADGREFEITRHTFGGVGSRDLSVVRSPAPNVERAVKFTTKFSQLDFGLDLAAGQYVVTMVAYGLSSGADSFWLSVDGRDKTAFHIPVGKFGPSSSAHTKREPTPNVTLDTSGLHRFTITLREAPNVMLDRVIFETLDGKTAAVVEAEDAPALPASMLKESPLSRFYVKSDGFAASKLVKRINNIGLRIRRLHQRYGGALNAGEARSVQNVFYNDTNAEPKDYDVRRIASASALLLKAGRPYGLYSARPEELKLDGLGTDAASLYLTASRLALLDLTRLEAMDIKSDHPVSMEVDLQHGRATAYATRDATVSVGSSETRVKPGTSALDLGRAAALERVTRAVGAALSRAMASAKPRPDRRETAVVRQGLSEIWRLPAAKEDTATYADEVQAILPADLDADGNDEVLVLRGKKLLCLACDGKPLWEFETEGVARAVCASDWDGDRRPEVFIGGDDERLYVLDAQGKELKRVQVDVLLRVGTSSVRRPRVSNIAVDDIDADGKTDVIVGTLNGNIVRYDTDLNKLWSFDRVEHGTRQMKLIDLDRDGVKEIVAANKYGAVEVVNATGRAMSGTYSELGDVVFDVADMTGDGSYEIINGSSTGALSITTWGKRVRGQFPNYGYGARDVRMADMDGDGKPDGLVASETGYVYVLDADCGVKARVKLTDSVLCLAPVFTTGLSAAEVFAGCADGRVYSLGGDMTVRRDAQLGFPVEIFALARAGDRRRLVLAGAGQVAALAVQ